MILNPEQTRFLCVLNDKQVCLSFGETLHALWNATVAYVRKPGWYRYKLGLHRRELYLDDLRFGKSDREILGTAELNLLFGLHMAFPAWLTREDLHEYSRQGTQKTVSHAAFVKRRSRLSNMFPSGWDPIENRCVPGEQESLLGYRFKKSCSPFMIIGTESDESFQWTQLLTQPTSG